MNSVYYFKIYTELCYFNAKSLPYVKRLYSVAPYCCSHLWDHLVVRVIEKNDFGAFSVLRTCPLQRPTTSCTFIAPRSLDHRTTSSNQLWSIERPMYAHYVVLPLELPVSRIALPYVSGPAPWSSLSITRAWSLFTRMGYDQVRLFLQLLVHSSCDHVEWCGL